MKNLLLTFSILFISMTAFSQTLDLNTSLSTDKNLVKGVLSNGMTYYIYKTDVVKEAASYYIIQNVGSVLENDNQKGLAHFLEHMAFNGTKNFPEKGVLSSLEKYGAVFGNDINASTGFDETVYNMNNIPTKDGMINTALLILHDWANELSLEEKEIDAERGVVTEEKRTRDSGRMRLVINSLPKTYVGAKYAERVPIGSMDIIANFKYKTLRDFYHDWYRTDLQAIAIIGDVNVAEVENKIKKLFSKIPAVENPKERYLVTIPENKEMLYFFGTDKETSSPSITFSIHSNKKLKAQTGEDLKNSLLNKIVTSILSKRLVEYAQSKDAPYLMAYTEFSSLSRTENNFSITIQPKLNMQNEAFKKTINIINSAVQFGVNKSELNREISILDNYYDTRIKTNKDTPHINIKTSIQDNYLQNLTFSDTKEEYKIAKAIFANLSPEDVQNHLKSLYTKKNRVLSIFGVEGNKNLTKQEALNILKDAENGKNIVAYKDEFSGKTLLSGITITPGEIISEKEVPEIGATTFILSNGIKVHYKYYNKQVNRVSLLAQSFGGISLVKDEDLPSAEQLQSLAGASGVGDYSVTDLMKVMAGKTASVGVDLSSLTGSIQGSSSTKDVESLLQLTYLRFAKPRFDQENFETLKHNLTNTFEESKKNIQMRMMDSTTALIFGKDNPRKRKQDEKYIAEVSFEKIKEIYNERFKDPSNFEFFITGDKKKENLKPLIEKYIASLPTYNTKETYKDNAPQWIHNKIDKDVYLEMEQPKTSVNITYKKNVEWNPKNHYLLSLLKDILTLRFTATLREEEGGTYGANAIKMLKKRPIGKAYLYVLFDCNPEKDEKLISIVHREINKIMNGDINDADIQKVITNYKKNIKERTDKNEYAQKLLYNYFIENINIDDPKNNLDILNAITKKDFQEFTKNFIEGADSYEIVYKPKK